MASRTEVLLVSKEAYGDLLELKNHISVKVRQITNKEIDKRFADETEHQISILDKFNPREIDYEPEYTFSDCIRDVISSVWNEQETGKVNFIT